MDSFGNYRSARCEAAHSGRLTLRDYKSAVETALYPFNMTATVNLDTPTKRPGGAPSGASTVAAGILLGGRKRPQAGPADRAGLRHAEVLAGGVRWGDRALLERQYLLAHQPVRRLEKVGDELLRFGRELDEVSARIFGVWNPHDVSPLRQVVDPAQQRR